MWLRSVPDVWDIVLLRIVAKVESGHTPSRSHPEYWDPGECIFSWFTLADIWQLREGNQKYLGDTKEKVSALGLANSGARLLPAGTVVLSRTASVGFSGIMPTSMATTQDFANFVCGPRLVPSYLLWALRGMTSEIDKLKRGSTHKTIYMPDVMQFQVPVPPLGRQRVIAGFLDRKTAAIDALIEKKERLIALLTEKRAALIHQAVTKGLDPEAPMKDSGVPWIGEIPAHWIVHRLRRVVSRFVDYRGRTPEKVTSGVPLITAGAVRDGVVDHSRAPEWVTEQVYEQLIARGKPERGDILFTSEAPLGEVGMVTDCRIACAQRIIMFKAESRRMNSGFLLHHFLAESGKGELLTRASGSTASGIRADRLKMSLVPTPPLPEQQSIVSHINRGTADHSVTATRITSQVAKLKEYRQALITAAVTGQLDTPEEPTP